MKNEVFTYENALDWANLDRVYIAVIERFSRPDHKTLINDDLRDVWRMEEYGDDVPDWNAIGDSWLFFGAYDSEEDVKK